MAMRAAVMRVQGPPEVLKVETDFPKPERKPGEVLIRVAAASINPIDVKMREGLQVPRFAVTLPKIPGGDVSGVVEEADPGSAFKPGDRVFACTGQQMFNVKYGTYAEWVSAPASTLAALPPGLSFPQGAAVPLAAMTAWQALEPRMPLEGKKVLVHAGAGGVGSFAIQIAKAQGAHVTSTCSGANVDLVTKQLGADRAVDYTKERFDDVAPGPYDVIVDLIGGNYETWGLPLLKKKTKDQPGGIYINLLTHGWNPKYGVRLGMATTLFCLAKGALLSALGLGPAYAVVAVQSKASRGLEQVAALLSEGRVKPLIDRVVPLEQVAEAHAHSEAGHARGKIVLQVAYLD